MNLRKLKYGCEHDRFEAHGYGCPGGVFLPDDTLIISRQALVLMGAERFYVVQVRDDGSYPMPLFDFLDALSVREAE